MAVTLEEVQLSRNRLVERYGAELLSLATMASFYHHTTRGLASDAVCVANFAMMVPCIKARVRELGLSWAEFIECLGMHERHIETLQIIGNLPD